MTRLKELARSKGFGGLCAFMMMRKLSHVRWTDGQSNQSVQCKRWHHFLDHCSGTIACLADRFHRLQCTQLDPFAIAAGTISIRVWRPSRVARLFEYRCGPNIPPKLGPCPAK